MAAAARETEPNWEVRTGVHCGSVVAGIVGHDKYQFDVWGDTVNMAARMAGQGSPGTVTMTHGVWLQVEDDCVELVSRCLEDQIDAAILVPSCPVCHQFVSLAARLLEEAGISTVIMGCARDIVEFVGVPRLLFHNFPLGNSAGLPHDPSSQVEIASLALDLLRTAAGPRTTVQSPFKWSGVENWQRDFSNAAILTKEEIARRREEFDKGKADAKKVKNAGK